MTRRLVSQASGRVEDLADIFKVLADPTRLRVLLALLDAGRCVHELCVRVGASQPTVSHHLRVLRGAHLVRRRRAGREVVYALDDEHVVVLLSEGMHHANHRPARGRSGGRRARE